MEKKPLNSISSDIVSLRVVEIYEIYKNTQS